MLVRETAGTASSGIKQFRSCLVERRDHALMDPSVLRDDCLVVELDEGHRRLVRAVHRLEGQVPAHNNNR